jgi:hypothetical protein
LVYKVKRVCQGTTIDNSSDQGHTGY